MFKMANLLSHFQDDYRVNLNYDVITKDMQPICPVDYCGCFTDPVTDFKGQYVKVSMCNSYMDPTGIIMSNMFLFPCLFHGSVLVSEVFDHTTLCLP